MSDTVVRKFENIDLADAMNNDATVIGVQLNGLGNKQDYQFTVGQLKDAVAAQLRKRIGVSSNGTSLNDEFFGSEVQTLSTNTQTYILDVDFTQDTGAQTVTLTNGGNFITGQIVIAGR